MSISNEVPASLLWSAIEAGELTPVFQPVFDLRSQSICGLEILARWNPPNRPAISPAEFIPLAEAAGLLPRLFEKLLSNACRHAASWPGRLTLAINISPLQLQGLGLPALISETVEPTGFPLSRLELEITEQAFTDLLEQPLTIARELKSRGVRLIMEGCGIVHSSLSRLKAFPFDTLKLDSGLISSLEQDSESRKIVGAIVALGQSLGLTTIAKGVERQTQAEVLMRMGCSAAQGWLYGHPLPAGEMPALLHTETPGRVVNVASVLADSSAYHLLKAEERIAHLEAAYNTTPLGLANLDLAFRYISVNETFANMFGRKVGSLIGHSVADVLPELRLQLVACLEQTLAAGFRTECEITVSDPSNKGSQLIYLHTCKSVYDPYGRLIGLSIAVIDITRRKGTEADLLKSEGNYRHADELNPHIPWTANADGSLIEISYRWHELTNLNAGTISNEEWIRNIHPEDLPSVHASWSSSMRTGGAYEAEYRVLEGNGRTRWVRARAVARLDAALEIERWYGIVEDIDDQKRIEAIAREKTERLEIATRQLELLVREDHLTGLANRRHFDETLQREVGSALRSQLPLALVMIDVDYFKSFNDSYGHVAGDACLRDVAAVLTKVFHRPTDLGARYGGEEFALILPNTTERGAEFIAEQILSAVRALGIEHNGSPSKKVTLSGELPCSPRREVAITLASSQN